MSLQIKNTNNGGYTMELLFNGKSFKKYCHPSRNTEKRKLYDAKQLLEKASKC